MFKRKKSYPVVVAEAQARAIHAGIETVVYQQGKIYDWAFAEDYSIVLASSNKPVIKLLVCMSNGTVVQ